MCGRSDTKTASARPCVAQDARRPRGSTRASSGSGPRRGSRRPARRGRSRRPAPTAASVVRSPSALPPVTTRTARRPRWYSAIGVVESGREDRRRPAVVLGRAQDDDRVGRPLVVALALRPDPDTSRSRRRRRARGSRRRRRRPGRAPSMRRLSGSVWAMAATRSRQRPWHFLYFAPEPHQHGSLRPIRAPVGVKPGFGPLADGTGRRLAGHRLVAERFAHRSRRRRAAGPPRRMAEPPTAAAAGTRAAAAGRRRDPRRRRARADAVRAVGSVAAAQRGRSPGERRGHGRIAAVGRGGGLAGDRDPEDRRRDAVPDEAAQLVVQLRRPRA